MLNNLFGPVSAALLFGTMGLLPAQTKSVPNQPTFAKDMWPFCRVTAKPATGRVTSGRCRC
jgi:hypothetical protein